MNAVKGGGRGGGGGGGGGNKRCINIPKRVILYAGLLVFIRTYNIKRAPVGNRVDILKQKGA